MANLPETSQWVETIYLLETTDPVLGGVDGISNRQGLQLGDRTRYLKDLLEAGHNPDGAHELYNSDLDDDIRIPEPKLNLSSATGDIKSQIDALQSRYAQAQQDNATTDSILGRQKDFRTIFDILNIYDDEKYFFEFFEEPFNLNNQVIVNDVYVVSGDDSVTVEDTSQLQVGSEYVIVAGGNNYEVTISSILSPTRFTTTELLGFNCTDGVMYVSSVDFGGDKTEFKPNDFYYSREVDFLGYGERKAFVLRREDTAAQLNIYYKDEISTEWTEGLRFDSRFSESGYRDDYYRVGNGNKTKIKIVAANNSNDLTVQWLCLFSSRILSAAKKILTPYNVSPANNATSVQPTGTLEGSSYYNLYDVAQTAAEFQVALDEKFENIIYTAVEESAVNTHNLVNDGSIVVDQVYYWRHRYKDADGEYSEWSSPTVFTTSDTLQYVKTPNTISPADGATGIREVPILVAGDYESVNLPGESHISSQWQISTSPTDFTTPVWDSGEDTTNLTSIVVPEGILQEGQIYYWRVRYNSGV